MYIPEVFQCWLERRIAGLWVGVPLAKEAEDFSWRGYSIVWDGRYDEQAEAEAGCTRDRFLTYEVESEGNYDCGQRVVFQGKALTRGHKGGEKFWDEVPMFLCRS